MAVGAVTPQRRGVALGLVAASAEAGSVVGPLYGGAIIEWIGWRIFRLDVPQSFILIALLAILPNRANSAAKMDYLGAMALGGALTVLTIALCQRSIFSGESIVPYFCGRSWSLPGRRIDHRRETRDPSCRWTGCAPLISSSSWNMKRKTSHVSMGAMMITSRGSGISLLKITLLMRVLTNSTAVPSEELFDSSACQAVRDSVQNSPSWCSRIFRSTRRSRVRSMIDSARGASRSIQYWAFRLTGSAVISFRMGPGQGRPFLSGLE